MVVFFEGQRQGKKQTRTVRESDTKSNQETVVWTGEWNTEPAGSDLAHPDKELEPLTVNPS
jgi:hypothetical protein